MDTTTETGYLKPSIFHRFGPRDFQPIVQDGNRRLPNRLALVIHKFPLEQSTARKADI